MSRENLDVVERAIAAVNARDIDAYLACCTDDVELRTPMAPVGGVYEGAAGIRRFLVDIEDAAPDFRIELQRVQVVGANQVLASMRVSSTGRVSGFHTVADSTNVYDFVAGRIERIRIFFDRREALETVGLAE
jgi:hypothetical protein